jgi:hypothetical protein
MTNAQAPTAARLGRTTVAALAQNRGGQSHPLADGFGIFA